MIRYLLMQWLVPAIALVVGIILFVFAFWGAIEFLQNLVENDSELWSRIRVIFFCTIVPTAALVLGHMAYVMFTRPGGF